MSPTRIVHIRVFYQVIYWYFPRALCENITNMRILITFEITTLLQKQICQTSKMILLGRMQWENRFIEGVCCPLVADQTIDLLSRTLAQKSGYFIFISVNRLIIIISLISLFPLPNYPCEWFCTLIKILPSRWGVAMWTRPTAWTEAWAEKAWE